MIISRQYISLHLGIIGLLLSLATGCSISSTKNTSHPSVVSEQTQYYLELPIDGQIGTDVTPDMVRKVLDYAKAKSVEHIVVRINTGGGFVPPAEAIWNLMYAYENDFRYHAYIEKAVSAGIWMAFASHTMHMTPSAIMGSASIYDTLSDNSVRLNEKSSAIFAAQIAAKSINRGYDPVIVRGMVIPGAEVWVQQDTDGTTHVTGFRPDTHAGGKLVCLDNPHTLLTLTAHEARMNRFDQNTQFHRLMALAQNWVLQTGNVLEVLGRLCPSVISINMIWMTSTKWMIRFETIPNPFRSQTDDYIRCCLLSITRP
ncbi:MAG: hypothetical protein HC898_12160 [Phycisphaerales bacterium]|nr:hypothetical protein [Phycisphaerales bacterium]